MNIIKAKQLLSLNGLFFSILQKLREERIKNVRCYLPLTDLQNICTGIWLTFPCFHVELLRFIRNILVFQATNRLFFMLNLSKISVQ